MVMIKNGAHKSKQKISIVIKKTNIFFIILQYYTNITIIVRLSNSSNEMKYTCRWHITKYKNQYSVFKPLQSKWKTFYLCFISVFNYKEQFNLYYIFYSVSINFLYISAIHLFNTSQLVNLHLLIFYFTISF